MNSTTRSVIEDIDWYQWVPYVTYNCQDHGSNYTDSMPLYNGSNYTDDKRLYHGSNYTDGMRLYHGSN